MLYFFHGENRKALWDAADRFIATLRKKRPTAGVFSFSPESFDRDAFEAVVAGGGLFDGKHIVTLDGVFSDGELREGLLLRVDEMASAEHIFVVLEGLPALPVKKKLSASATETKEFVHKTKKQERYNVFSITDAVVARDRRRAWIGYREAIASGIAPEEIHGAIWWLLKTVVLVLTGETEGMKPFSVSKARSFLRKYSAKETQEMLRDIVSLYHEARRGGADLELALERWFLRI